jgi:hypothetical protein
MGDPFEALRLTNNPYVRNMNAEQKARFAAGVHQYLDDPKMKERLMRLGGGKLAAQLMGVIDIPRTEEGVKGGMIRPPKGIIQKTGASIGKGAAAFTQMFGADRPLLKGVDVLTGHGGKDMGVSPDIDISDDPVAQAANIASFLVPAVGMLGGLTSLAAATGLTAYAPVSATVGSFAATGAAMETARQFGRNVTRDEPWQPSLIPQEAAIFAASGVPFGGGPVVRRALAGASAGAAAVAAPPLFGNEVDPMRAAMEVAFGTAFGNPKLGDVQLMSSMAKLEKSITNVKEAAKSIEPTPGPKKSGQAKELAGKQTVEQLRRKVKSKKLSAAARKLAQDALAIKTHAQEIMPDAPVQKPPKKKIHGQPGEVREQLTTGKPPQSIQELAMKVKKAKTAKRALEAQTPQELVGGFDETLRNIFHPDFDLELTRLRQSIELTRVEIAETPANKDLPEKLGFLEKRLRTVEARQKSYLSREVPPEVTTMQEAQHVIRRILEGDDGLAKVAAVIEHLPPQLKPYEAAIKAMYARAREYAARPDLQAKELDAMVGKMEENQPITRTKGPQPGETDLLTLAKNTRDEAIAQKAMREDPYTNIELTPEKPSTVEAAPAPPALPKRSRAITFKDLRQRAADMDIQLTIETGKVRGTPTYYASHKGSAKPFLGLKAVRDYLDEVQAIIGGKPPLKPTQLAVEQAAATKLIEVQHSGHGEYTTLDHKTGVKQTHPNLKEAAKTVAAAKAPDVPELTGTPDMTGGGGATSTPGPGGSGRYAGEPASAAQFPSSFHVMVNTHNLLFKKIQDATGWKVFDTVFEPAMRATNARTKYQRPFFDTTNAILKGVKVNRFNAVLDLMIAGKNKARLVRELDASKPEIAAAERLKQTLESLLNTDAKGVRRFLEEIVPAARRVKGDPELIRDDYLVDEVIADIHPNILRGDVSLAEPNVHTLMSDIILAKGQTYFMDPVYTALRSEMQKVGAIQNKKGVDAATKSMARVTNEILQRFHDELANSGQTAGTATARVLNKFLDGLKERGLFEGRGEITQKDVSRWATNLAGYYGGMAMSMRPALVFRNFWQRTLPAYKVGYATNFRAQNLALTAEGKALVEQAKVIPTQVTWMMDDVAEAMSQMGVDHSGIATVVNSIRRLQDAGMYMYRKADHGNRAVSYLSGYLSIIENAPLLMKGDERGFLIKTGLALDTQTVQRRVLRNLEQIEPGGWENAVKKAGHEYGMRITEDVQFIYHKANAPRMFHTAFGRLFGQFGLWPVSWTEYAIRGAAGVPEGLISAARGRQLSAREAASMRFTLRGVAQLTALAAVGAELGIDVSSYNKANVLSFEGGPWFQISRDLATIGLQTGTPLDQQLAAASIKRGAPQMINPFWGVTQDFYDAQEQHGWRYWAALMGFSLREPKSIINLIPGVGE